MALTDIEIKDTIYTLLREKGLHTEISGRIYKDNRPDNSVLEDVEISILDGDAKQRQDEQSQVEDRRQQNAVGADLLAAEFISQLRGEEHDHGHGQVLEHGGQHGEPGRLEEVVEEIGVIALAEHLRRQEKHAGKADRHEGLAL